ncbi:MAG: hypothetical protein LBD11_01625 [Candidatus Peribacteria bacterium]|nr:hypothetical protein [Candidatus Peribacteria bacterium]
MNTTIRNSDTDELKNIFPDSNPEYRRYLTVLNYKENPFTGCVNFSAGFALNTTTINVWAQYGDTEVGLHSDFSEPFPDLLQGLSDISQHN